MSTDLAVPQARSDSLDSKIRFAQCLADASLLPASYRGKPANVLLAIEMGEALGLPTIQAINGIHVVEGRPTASADLLAALIRRAGHKLRIQVDDINLVAVATLIRVDDPEFPYVARWDMAKAKAAGLLFEDRPGHIKKDNWRNYPGQMLRARAISEVARSGATDALYGVSYTPEELGAETDGEGVLYVEIPTDLDGNIERVPAVEAPAVEPRDGETEAQFHERKRKRMFALFNEMGLSDRDSQVMFIEDVLKRPLGSRSEMYSEDYVMVIEALEAEQRTQQQPEIEDAEVTDPETGEVTT